MAFKLFAILNLIKDSKTFYSFEEVLEALTSAGEEKNIDRFSSIVEGLQHNSVQLQVRFFYFIHLFATFIFIDLY